jgi:hypothetical protein
VSGEVDARRVFRDDLFALWRKIGTPSILALALRMKHPVARYQFLTDLGGPSLPDWMDVQALLEAAGETHLDTVTHWRRRWETLYEPCHDRDRTSDRDRAKGILRNALGVKSREEFVMRLEDLRKALNISFAQIARNAQRALPRSTANWMVQRGNFPTRADQVRHFVSACGATAEEANLWIQAWERARHLHQSASCDDDREVYAHKRVAEALAAQGRYRQAYEHVTGALEIAMRGRPVPGDPLQKRAWEDNLGQTMIRRIQRETQSS